MSGSVFAQSAIILFREGLEAILVLAALAAVLRRMAPDRMAALWGGAALGLLASLAAAVAFITWRGGAHDDLLEGVTCLIAAGLMLWTGGWLWRRSDPRAWAASLQRQTQAALAAQRVALTVGAIGFLAVFREGAETILFLAALGNDLVSLAGGIAAASVLLAALWWLVMKAAVRLPLRPMFMVTSVFLLLMAARFVGAAIMEFQEQVLLPFDPAELPAWLESLGFAPSWEGLAAQLLVLGGVAAVLLWPQRRAAAAAAE